MIPTKKAPAEQQEMNEAYLGVKDLILPLELLLSPEEY